MCPFTIGGVAESTALVAATVVGGNTLDIPFKQYFLKASSLLKCFLTTFKPNPSNKT